MKINLIKSHFCIFCNLLNHEGSVFYPYSKADEDKLDKFSNAVYVVDIKNQDIRTLKQNNALHLWCSQIATLLNSKALYMKGIFGNDIVWTMDLVKTQVVKSTIKQIFGISSTTKLQRKEIDEMVDYITTAFGHKGIEIPEFPNKKLWDEIKE